MRHAFPSTEVAVVNLILITIIAIAVGAYQRGYITRGWGNVTHVTASSRSCTVRFVAFTYASPERSAKQRQRPTNEGRMPKSDLERCLKMQPGDRIRIYKALGNPPQIDWRHLS